MIGTFLLELTRIRLVSYFPLNYSILFGSETGASEFFHIFILTWVSGSTSGGGGCGVGGGGGSGGGGSDGGGGRRRRRRGDGGVVVVVVVVVWRR